jgi:hypothetical protein
MRVHKMDSILTQQYTSPSPNSGLLNNSPTVSKSPCVLSTTDKFAERKLEVAKRKALSSLFLTLKVSSFCSKKKRIDGHMLSEVLNYPRG